MGIGFSTLLLAVTPLGSTWAQSAPNPRSGQSAASLLEKYEALSGQLAQNSYGRPIYLESSETSSMVSGNAYAVLDSPFNTVNTTLKNPARWCDVMILHINTKFCKANTDVSQPILNVNIGKKTPQELSDTFALEFAFRPVSVAANYLAVQLNAEKGPLGTNNYQIELDATPLPGGKTFMHLRYSYGYGMAGRMAMQGYLLTLGSGKVGFTPVNTGQKQEYVGGMRGAVERNTMRYYLAIDAYLDSLNAPSSQQVDMRLEQWFKSTEQYPKQLREIDLPSYLVMKKSEMQRQQNGA